MLNYIGIIKPFKLQWFTIVEKSGAFCLADLIIFYCFDWRSMYNML